jgi:hypothetical protein
MSGAAKARAHSDENSEPARFSYLLLLPSMGFWLIFSLSHFQILIDRLATKGIPSPVWMYMVGYALWATVGVVSLIRIHGKAHDPDYTYRFSHAILPLLLLLVILITSWLAYFNFIETPRTLFLELHFLGPFMMLLQYTIMKRGAGKSPASGRWSVLSQRSSKTLTNGSLLLFSLILFTFIAEFSFRQITGIAPLGKFKDFGKRYDFVLSPYVMFAEPDSHHGGDLNTQGFPGRELALSKGRSEVRIAIIGGSAVWSGKTEFSIAAYLEKELKMRHPETECRVVNWGRQSYISMQELILLQRNVLPLNFDLIIIYDGYNDLFVPMFAEGEVGYPYLYTNLRQRSEVNFINLRYVHRFLASKSAIFHHLMKSTISEDVSKHFDLGKCIEEYRRNLYQMALLARGYGSRIMFCVQPYIGKKLKSDSEQRLASREFLEKMEPAYSMLVESAKEVAEGTGSYYLNTVDLFKGTRQELFYDRVHIYPESGNRMVAGYMAAEILNLGLSGERGHPEFQGLYPWRR